MLIGICIKGLNAIYFDRKLDFYHEFIPQVLLLTCMFGYMDWMIVAKWTTNWDGREGDAPSIVNKMIQLFLNFGEHTTDNEVDLLPDQIWLNKLMLLVIVVAPPWILFAKPYILYKQHEELMKEKEDNGGDFEMKSVKAKQNPGARKKKIQQSGGHIQMINLEERDDDDDEA